MAKSRGRSLAEFRPLLPAEEQLLAACVQGTIVSGDDVLPTAKSAKNKVRADFVAFLAMGGDEHAPVHHEGVRFRGLWVEGPLRLNGANMSASLWMQMCRFEGALNLEGCTLGGRLSLSKSLIDGLTLDQAVVRQSVFLQELQSTGEVRLLGAQIGGVLNLQNAKLNGAEGDALSMDGVVVKGSVFLDELQSVGTVRLLGAQIEGSLILQRAKLDGKGGDALWIDGAVVRDDVYLDELQSTGELRLLGVQIGGDLACQTAKLKGNGRDALSMDSVVVKGNVFLQQLQSTGEVRLLGARIGGSLNVQEASLDGQESDALSMDGIVVMGNAFLQELQSKGKLRLLNAQISGSLNLQKANIDGKNGVALSMDLVVVKGNVFLQELQCTGEVRMLDAQVGSSVNFQKAKLDGKEGHALAMDRAVVKGSVFLGELKSVGDVRMSGAQIDGDLNFDSCAIISGSGPSFSAEGAEVKGKWLLRNLPTPLHGVNLLGFRVSRLVDDLSAWGDALALDGFHYDSFAGGAPVDAVSRIEWLRKQRTEHLGNSGSQGAGQHFKPQPWKHLQRVLRDTGHTEEARQVAIALEEHLRQMNLIGQSPANWAKFRRQIYRWAAVSLHWSFGTLIGYGYRPLRVVGWMALVWFVSALFYWCAAFQGVMGPSNPLIFNDPRLAAACNKNWYLCSSLPEEYTGFSPFAYSLDLLLPVVNLEQEKDWTPLIPTPQANIWSEWLGHWSFKHVIRIVMWTEILFGWVSSLLLVAVLSGLTKRRDE